MRFRLLFRHSKTGLSSYVAVVMLQYWLHRRALAGPYIMTGLLPQHSARIAVLFLATVTPHAVESPGRVKTALSIQVWLLDDDIFDLYVDLRVLDSQLGVASRCL